MQSTENIMMPLVIHTHVPKTAGTSVCNIFRRNYGDRHLDLYDPHPARIFQENYLEEVLKVNPEVVSISSHSFRRPFYQLGEHKTRIFRFCFLRSPVDWVISNLTYLKHNYENLSAEHRTLLPPDTPQLSIEDFLANRLAYEEQTQLLPGNWICRYFSEAWFMEEIVPQMITESGTVPTLVDFRQKFMEVAVEETSKTLKSMDFVGITEQIDQSVLQLAAGIRSLGLTFEVEEVPEDNVSRHILGETSWMNEGNPTFRKLQELLTLDVKIYSLFKDELEKRDAKGPSPSMVIDFYSRSNG
jgi:hypothetical protein